MFSINQNLTKILIPQKFQGVQYYASKSADLALKDRLELSEKLKLKKSKDMIGNNRNPNLGSIGVRFGEDHEVTINQKKEFNKKLKLRNNFKIRTY